MSIRVCFINFPPDEYFKELRTQLDRFDIFAIPVYLGSQTRRDLDLNHLSYFCDILYYVNSWYPIDDIVPLIRYNRRSKIVYAVHAPVVFKNILGFRPMNYIWQIISIYRVLLEKFADISVVHTLNTFDFKVFRAIGYRAAWIPWGLIDLVHRIRSNTKEEKFTILFLGARYGKGGDFAYHVFRYMLLREILTLMQ
jgi:hypothetical protein